MKYILVDYENVHDLDYSPFLTAGMVVKVFVGELQAKITTDFAMLMQKHKDLLFLNKISGNGKNALDFHIAYEMGRIFCTDQNAVCYVFSKDTGYDPLIENIRKQHGKKHCYRVESLDAIPLPKAKAQPAPKKSPSANTILAPENILKWLHKSSQNRPGSVDAFLKSVQNLAKPKVEIKKKQVEALLKELESKKKLKVTDAGKITYSL